MYVLCHFLQEQRRYEFDLSCCVVSQSHPSAKNRTHVMLSFLLSVGVHTLGETCCIKHDRDPSLFSALTQTAFSERDPDAFSTQTHRS
jgi:hypothetical protein